MEQLFNYDLKRSMSSKRTTKFLRDAMDYKRKGIINEILAHQSVDRFISKVKNIEELREKRHGVYLYTHSDDFRIQISPGIVLGRQEILDNYNEDEEEPITWEDYFKEYHSEYDEEYTLVWEDIFKNPDHIKTCQSMMDDIIKYNSKEDRDEGLDIKVGFDYDAPVDGTFNYYVSLKWGWSNDNRVNLLEGSIDFSDYDGFIYACQKAKNEITNFFTPDNK